MRRNKNWSKAFVRGFMLHFAWEPTTLVCYKYIVIASDTQKRKLVKGFLLTDSCFILHANHQRTLRLCCKCVIIAAHAMRTKPKLVEGFLFKSFCRFLFSFACEPTTWVWCKYVVIASDTQKRKLVGDFLLADSCFILYVNHQCTLRICCKCVFPLHYKLLRNSVIIYYQLLWNRVWYEYLHF